MAPTTQPDRHLEHVRGFLELLRMARQVEAGAGMPKPPPTLYIGAEETEANHFDELIGFRLRGGGSVQLGTASFRRQESDTPYARRSIGSYLCRPPKRITVEGSGSAANLLEVCLPDAHETIPKFLDRTRRGEVCRRIHLDAALIEFAFDFRTENPAPEKQLEVHRKPLQNHVLRTVEGHVLSGRSLGLLSQLHRGIEFFMVTDTLQHTPDGDYPLPSLAINRDFISVEAALKDESLESWIENTRIFDVRKASTEHLLDPTYRPLDDAA